MTTLMNIGEAATAAGVSAKMIRHYAMMKDMTGMGGMHGKPGMAGMAGMKDMMQTMMEMMMQRMPGAATPPAGK